MRNACRLFAAVAVLGLSCQVHAAIGDGGPTNNTITTSTSSSEVLHDTLVTQNVDTYSTRLLAVLDGSTTVYDQTFNVAFSDPLVQAAVSAAQSALAAAAAPNGVTTSGPTQTSTTTTLASSSANTVVDSTTSTVTQTTEITIGPGTVLIGNRDLGGTPFQIVAGQSNININTHTQTDIFRTITTINTFLTTSVWTLLGSTVTSGGGGGGGTVPEPSMLMLLLMLGTLLYVARRRGLSQLRR